MLLPSLTTWNAFSNSKLRFLQNNEELWISFSCWSGSVYVANSVEYNTGTTCNSALDTNYKLTNFILRKGWRMVKMNILPWMLLILFISNSVATLKKNKRKVWSNSYHFSLLSVMFAFKSAFKVYFHEREIFEGFAISYYFALIV